MLKAISIVWGINFLVNFIVIQQINKLHVESNLPAADLSKQLLTAFLVPNFYILVIGGIFLILKFILDSIFDEMKPESDLE